MRATITSRCALRWDPAFPSVGEDRPETVRAASGVVHAFGGLAVILDDASFLAFVDPATGLARSVALPHEARGRRRFEPALGNKADKLDLESLVAWQDGNRTHLLAFGSGSTAARERWVHAAGTSPTDLAIAVVDAAPVYAALREHLGLDREQLNLEGALWLGEAAGVAHLRFFQRGNGTHAVDATVDVEAASLVAWLAGQGAAPVVIAESVRRYGLGALDGVRLGFTDACLGPGGAVFALAAAEASPDTFDDGVVTGSVVARLDAAGTVTAMARIAGEDGGPVDAKAEGVAWVGAGLDPDVWVVIDRDDPAVPSELWRVRLSDA